MPEPVRIKICGVRDAETARVAVDAGADAIGLVFVDRSPRYVSIEQARAIANAVRGDAAIVGVFKDAPSDAIGYVDAEVGLDEWQLHGNIQPSLVAGSSCVGTVVAIPFDPDRIRVRLAQWVDAATSLSSLRGLLVDTPDPTKLGGGTGQVFDWSALRRVLDEFDEMPPIILAGGLNADNVGEAIEVVRPWGVDVSSGVESLRGVKDVGRIRAFCEAAKGG